MPDIGKPPRGYTIQAGDASNYPALTLDKDGTVTSFVTYPAGGGGGSVNITATSPVVVTPSPLTGTGVVSHANSGVAAGTYGFNLLIPKVVVNATGHITSASQVEINPPGLIASISTTPTALTRTQRYSPASPNQDPVVYDAATITGATFTGGVSGSFDTTTGIYTANIQGMYLVDASIYLNGFFLDNDPLPVYNQILLLYLRSGTLIGDLYGKVMYHANTANAGEGQLFGKIHFSHLLQLGAGDTLQMVVQQPGVKTGYAGALEVTYGSGFRLVWVSAF